MGRLVVHVGPWKTASTSFQRGLFANADVLWAHGVYLPRAGRLELEPRAVCHHHLAWELMGSPRFRPDIGGWDALAAEIAGVDAQTVLISSEVLGWAVVRKGIGDLLDERLKALGRSVTVVYVVRDQLSQINSEYAQHVKLLEYVEPFARHAAGVVRRGEADLERQTSRWYRSPDVEFVAVPFTRISEPDPLVALLLAAGIDVPEGDLDRGTEIANITLGPMAVEAIKLLRSYLVGLNPALSADDMAIRRLHRIAARAARDASWCDEPFWGWPPALATRTADQLAASNERFAQQVWGSSWPLPLPVDRQPSRVDLLQLPADDLDRVHDFVVAMARRYVELRRGQRSG